MRYLGSCIALFSAVTALSSAALAQDLAVANAMFKKGLADMEAGRFDTACPAFGESMRLDPRPGTLFTLAECEAKAGKIATAVARYEDYLQLFARLSPQQQQKQLGREQIVADRKQALSGDVPLLTLKLPPAAPTGTRVLRDGIELARPALGVALPVDPGEHVIVVQVPDQPPIEQRITVAKKENKILELEAKAVKVDKPAPVKVDAPPPLSAPPPPEAQTTSGRRTAAYVLGGVGIAGVVVGSITGALVFAKKGDISANCRGLDCDQTGIDAVGSGRTLALVSTLGFIAGAAGLTGGAVLFLTEPKPKLRTGAGPRWVSAGVEPTGRDGVLARIQGVW